MKYEVFISDNKAIHLGFLVDESYEMTVRYEQYVLINESKEKVLLSALLETGVTLAI